MRNESITINSLNDLGFQDLPVPANSLQPRLRDAAERQWSSDKNLRDFKKAFRGCALSIYNGFPKQAEIYQDECMDILDADRADAALCFTKQLRLKQVKLFALANPKGNSIFVRGRGRNDWRITPVNRFEDRIPLEHLETLTKLRQHDIKFDGFGVAMPVQRRSLDPILLGRFGKYWIEIGRWA